MSTTDPATYNYESVDTCDGCDTAKAAGVMYHAQGATGRICEVLFLCHECGHTEPNSLPPVED